MLRCLFKFPTMVINPASLIKNLILSQDLSKCLVEVRNHYASKVSDEVQISEQLVESLDASRVQLIRKPSTSELLQDLESMVDDAKIQDDIQDVIDLADYMTSYARNALIGFQGVDANKLIKNVLDQMLRNQRVGDEAHIATPTIESVRSKRARHNPTTSSYAPGSSSGSSSDSSSAYATAP